MKILFFARHYSYLRLFESGIAELARRGHQLHLSADREESMGGRRMVERLAEQYPTITLGATPGRAPGAWAEFARRLRLGIDYLRYLDPRYAETPHLRARARDRAPRTVVALAERLGPGGRDTFARVLRTLERGVPPSPELERSIAAQHPDVVLVTPLIELGSPQMDHLAAARALGVRTALPVASWDHLSSKAVIRNVPDLVLVWMGGGDLLEKSAQPLPRQLGSSVVARRRLGPEHDVGTRPGGEIEPERGRVDGDDARLGEPAGHGGVRRAALRVLPVFDRP